MGIHCVCNTTLYLGCKSDEPSRDGVSNVHLLIMTIHLLLDGQPMTSTDKVKIFGIYEYVFVQ